MNRIEANVTTGERKVVALTQAEIDDAMARTEAEATQRAAEEAVRADAGLREKAIEAMLVKAALDPLAPKAVKDYVSAKG